MEEFADQVARKTREAQQAQTVRAAKDAAEKASLERAISQMRASARALAAVLFALGRVPQCELVEQRAERSRWRRHYTYHYKTTTVGWLIAYTWSTVTDIGSWVDGEILASDGRVLLFEHMHGSIADLMAPARVIYSPGHSSSSLLEAGGSELWDRSMYWHGRRQAEQVSEHLAELAARHAVDPAFL
ncbi:MAG TPA: hypothetical protein VFA06_12380 [Actinocrinis sp.]|jgi:hypothetical protein|uniref:hypothetical protein n=1 Tax=Actinocrinis sp. TaxID=1920516 RepID=UPI002D3131E6|nr:hypothetical protein [Actinocrinis sp.]HZU56660.1 hypothetical protein [Actinocrinis sp.]